MAETIGALILELRLDSAKFTAAMDAANKATKGAGQQANEASRMFARFAADGIGSIVPIGFKAENALQRLIVQMIAGKGALAALGPAAAVVGATFAGFFAGNFLQNFRELGNTTTSFGERIKVAAGFMGSFEERLRKATEAQKAFGSEMAKSRDLLRNLDAELAELQGNQLKAIGLRSEGREAGAIAALGGARATGALERIRAVRAEQERKFFEEQQKLRDENEQKVLDQIRKERDEQLKVWQTETAFLADQLKARLKLRQDFEAQLGTGGLPGQEGGAGAGFASARRLREQIQKEARDLAFLEREGLISQTDSSREREAIRTRALTEVARLKAAFSGLPAVLEAVDKAVESVEFGNFGTEMAKARTEIAVLAPTLDTLNLGVGQLAAQFAKIPSAADPTSAAIRQLTADYIGLANAVYGVINANSLLVSEEARTSQVELPNTGIQVVE